MTLRHGLGAATLLALLAVTGCSSEESAVDDGSDPTPPSSPVSSDPLPARWWQWAGSFSRGEDPISDETGARCGDHQPDDVWFLAGTFGGAATRTCRVPKGRPVYLTVLNQVCESTGDDRRDLAGCRFAVEESSATLDGEPLGVEEDDVGSFDLDVAEDSAVGFPAGPAAAVAWGAWVGPVDLEPGRHVLEVSGAAGDFRVSVHYRLLVG